MGVARQNSPSSLANLNWSLCSVCSPCPHTRSSRRKGPPAACKVHEEMELNCELFVTVKRRHSGARLWEGSREKAAEPSVTHKICRAGRERGNNLGVALSTLITQMLEALGCSSSGAELLQLSALSTAVEHRSWERSLMKH